MFKLIVKKEFSSAHILHGHPGNCKRMHGHNWLVEAEVEGDNTNEIGMVIDFKDIKNIRKSFHQNYFVWFGQKTNYNLNRVRCSKTLENKF